MKSKGLGAELIGEVFGTFVLILLGDGVVANVGLAPRLAGTAYNWNTITFGWCFAVIVAVYISGGVSGAHLNPAVTLGLAAKRGFPWSKVGPFILAQIAGAFLGALGVYLVYMEGLVASGMPNVWCTGPGSVFGATFWGGASQGAIGPYSLVNACIAEFFGTCMLLWGICASGDSKNMGLMHNLGPFLVGFTVLAVGFSLGGPSGYSINRPVISAPASSARWSAPRVCLTASTGCSRHSWFRPSPAQSPSGCTICLSPPIYLRNKHHRG
jgi:glycerol uptake facilitator protein